nr:nucleotidyl transferase AbiEii/AbiGii toxin family protein [Akkermansiaceae bacterium]
MLHYSAIPVGVRAVLNTLAARMPGSGFALAGGTSLALRFGHRISVDLDFFTAGEFDPESLQRRL